MPAALVLFPLMTLAQGLPAPGAKPVIDDSSWSGLTAAAQWLLGAVEHRQHKFIVVGLLIVVVELVNRSGVGFAKACGWAR